MKIFVFYRKVGKDWLFLCDRKLPGCESAYDIALLLSTLLGDDIGYSVTGRYEDIKVVCPHNEDIDTLSSVLNSVAHDYEREFDSYENDCYIANSLIL